MSGYDCAAECNHFWSTLQQWSRSARILLRSAWLWSVLKLARSERPLRRHEEETRELRLAKSYPRGGNYSFKASKSRCAWHWNIPREPSTPWFVVAYST